MGRSPGTIKTVLLAATWGVSMGIVEHNVPIFFWKYVKGADFFASMSKGRRTLGMTKKYSGDRLRPCRQWLPTARTQPNGRCCQHRYCRQWRVRVGEMAGVKVRGLDGIAGTITLSDEKINRRAYTRRTGQWAMRWVGLLHWWAIEKMRRSPNEPAVTGPRQLERLMAKLLAGSKWQDIRWCRLCAATLFQVGAPMPNIKSW